MRRIVVILAILFAPTVLLAQQPQTQHERIRAMKVAYITEKLQLSSAEAQGFWPLYNDWERRSFELKKQERKITKNIRANFHTMSEAELDKLLNEQITIKQKQLDLLKHFNVKYKEVISVRKVAMLYGVEKQWKKELLYKIKEKQKRY